MQQSWPISISSKIWYSLLKAKIYKIDIGKLKTVPVDFSKLSWVVNTDVVNKTVSDKLDANVNNIDTSGFVSKTKYDTYKADLEKKITNISEFVKKKQITTSALTADENKIPDVSTLVKKKKKWVQWKNIRHWKER